MKQNTDNNPLSELFSADNKVKYYISKYQQGYIWRKVHDYPSYIFDLLLSIINVSVQTVDIVERLPKLKFE